MARAVAGLGMWDRPPLREVGDPIADGIYLAVGKALSQWERAEEGFAILFEILIESRSVAAARAYGSITNSAGRREALRSAAEVTFETRGIGDIDRREFKELMMHFEKASSRRDDIAHGIVMYEMVGDQNLGWFLLVPTYNTGRSDAFFREQSDVFWDRGKYRYVAEDVSVFRGKFETLTVRVFDYVSNIRTKINSTVE
jgi:hypothetical protein